MSKMLTGFTLQFQLWSILAAAGLRRRAGGDARAFQYTPMPPAGLNGSEASKSCCLGAILQPFYIPIKLRLRHAVRWMILIRVTNAVTGTLLDVADCRRDQGFNDRDSDA
jgi:hypothetical protein